MRYFIIFLITFILLLLILFYNPYLGVYKDYINISLEDSIENYDWSFETDNDNIKLVDSTDHSWKFKINKNGITNLNFIYSDSNNIKYQIFYKLKIKNNKIYWLEGYGKGLLSYPNPY